MQAPLDLRRSPRFDSDLSATLMGRRPQQAWSGEHAVGVGNISQTGCFVVSELHPAEGTEVALRFARLEGFLGPGVELRIIGTVVHQRRNQLGQMGFGVRFVAVSAMAQLKRVLAMLDTQQSQPNLRIVDLFETANRRGRSVLELEDAYMELPRDPEADETEH